MRTLISTLFLVSIFTTVYCQNVVDVELLQQISKESVEQTLSVFTDQIVPESGVDIYRMTYTTTGSDGLLDTASGLFVLPDQIKGTLPLAVYHHGTISGRSAAPSKLVGQEYLFSAIMASLDLILIMPDYLGIGESRGIHPYVHAETEGRASADMILAVKSYLWQQQIAFSKQLFLTGYSQGGHAAMAAHKYIQENVTELDVTASVPMSGPYFISRVMRGLVEREQPYFYPAYLVYTLLGMQEVNGDIYDSLEHVFRPEFIPAIRAFTATGDGLFDLNRELLSILTTNYEAAYPRYLFNDTILNQIIMNDDHPVNVALRESDLHDWVPDAPVLMLYCEGDDQVPYTNSTLADSTMNALGATNVTAEDVSGGRMLDHTQCVLPALLRAIPWILDQVDRQTTNTDDILLSPGVHERITIAPNPATTHVEVSIPESAGLVGLSLFHIDGKLVLHRDVRNVRQLSLPLRDLRQGLYILHTTSHKGAKTHKIIKY